LSESILAMLTNNRGGAPELVMFALVLVVLTLRPQGLFGQREETEDKVAFVPILKALPARLRDTTGAKGLRIIAWLAAAFVCAIVFFTGSTTNGILVDVLIYSMVGVSLTILMGYAGQISLGHWGLVGVGAFGAGNVVTRCHVAFVVAIPFTVLLGMFVSLIIGLPALRVRGW